MNIGVLCSGNGSNLQAIINAIAKRKIKNAKIKVVIADKKNAYALKRAEKHKIETLFIDPKKYKSRDAYDKNIIAELKKRKIQLVVLAGFMRILTPVFIKAYKNKILNIHPALLPSFKGAHGIKDAYNYGVKVTGVTVHFVTDDLDAGPIILQEAVEVKKNDTLTSLEKRIHKIEHKLYPKAINLFVNKKLKIKGNKVRISL